MRIGDVRIYFPWKRLCGKPKKHIVHCGTSQNARSEKGKKLWWRCGTHRRIWQFFNDAVNINHNPAGTAHNPRRNCPPDQQFGASSSWTSTTCKSARLQVKFGCRRLSKPRNHLALVLYLVAWAPAGSKARPPCTSLMSLSPAVRAARFTRCRPTASQRSRTQSANLKTFCSFCSILSCRKGLALLNEQAVPPAWLPRTSGPDCTQSPPERPRRGSSWWSRRRRPKSSKLAAIHS